MLVEVLNIQPRATFSCFSGGSEGRIARTVLLVRASFPVGISQHGVAATTGSNLTPNPTLFPIKQLRFSFRLQNRIRCRADVGGEGHTHTCSEMN